jgi:hypothetical protein
MRDFYRKRQIREISQVEYVLIHLKRSGGVTTLDLRDLGVSHPAGVIKYLRQSGYAIETELIDVTNPNGLKHKNMALYTIKEEQTNEGGYK